MKRAIASGLIGLIALGGAGVAIPAAFAQDAEDGESRQERQTFRQESRTEHRAEKIETLSTLLGVSAEELQTALEDGQSLADFAATQGVDTQVIIDALVQDMQARIDTMIADGTVDAERGAEISERIEERVAARVNGEVSARHEARAEHRAEKLESLTSALGVTAEDLQTARQNGESLADVAAAQGIDVQTLVDVLVEDAQARIDAKVADGAIDADRAAEKSAAIEERITARVNGERPEGREGRGHRGHRTAPSAEGGDV